jgi:hypothetical protein
MLQSEERIEKDQQRARDHVSGRELVHGRNEEPSPMEHLASTVRAVLG